MKGLWKYISPFAPDQSGAGAVLYGMGVSLLSVMPVVAPAIFAGLMNRVGFHKEVPCSVPVCAVRRPTS